MGLLRRFLILITAFALVAASLTVSMASSVEAADTMQADMSAATQPDTMPGCPDCGRNAVPANACTLHCVAPPAAIAAVAALIPLPAAVPTAMPVRSLAGRVLAPDLHPPRVVA